MEIVCRPLFKWACKSPGCKLSVLNGLWAGLQAMIHLPRFSSHCLWDVLVIALACVCIQKNCFWFWFYYNFRQGLLFQRWLRREILLLAKTKGFSKNWYAIDTKSLLACLYISYLEISIGFLDSYPLHAFNVSNIVIVICWLLG